MESELRFLHDRSGVDETQDGTSVDSAIRRLRRAIAMHEEETNKKIANLEQLIEERKHQIDDIDENKAAENLELADSRERDGIEKLKSAFIETASKIHMHQLEHTHYDNAADFHNSLKETISHDITEKQARREAQRDELRKLEANLDEIRQERKSMLSKFKDSIRNKRLHEEEADLITIIGSEEEQPPPNMPISAINANNTKVENDIQIAKATRKEIEDQIDRLLEEGVKLKAEINEMTAKVDRAKKLKERMEKQFKSKLSQTNESNDKLKNELASIKSSRKDVKKDFAKANSQFDEYLKQVNQLQTEQQLLAEVIRFKEAEKKRIDGENEKTKNNIDSLKDEISLLHEELCELSNELANAAEKQKRVEALVEINNNDPRCSMKSPPPELAQLLESLNAVNEKLD
ncbi:hypothetical protein TRFO_09828 [Tritrichomonas foetus]|uniref:Uncharacterized protein n=1 Tax=Tritrichomonas foetus TaxID=1144522 RepID=A0A1J4JC05_9EUKA|nr:hypothetical protein TRFO_09828 [Tritrichomonas foetus]|eukprot:OHS96672.1 hypothetical protein TRFO_09828 [Tritrichomonas foetus]